MDTQIWTVYLCFWLILLGAVLGSFLDCAVSRWAAGKPPFSGRSRCDACGRTLAPRELVPVVSFLLQRGRCRHCGEKIPADCLWAELAGALSFLCLGLTFGPRWELGQWAVFAALLLAVSLADCAKRIIPDRLLLVLALNRPVWVLLLREDPVTAGLSALSGCAVAGALLLLVLLAEHLRRREVMGGGDIKLLLALGLYLDWTGMLLTLLAACLLGLLWAAASGKGRGTAVPFGPFLALGAVGTVCFGGPVIRWYLGLF